MKLKRSTLFYYGLTELPINIALFPVLVFIPKYYSVDMGISLFLAANIILAVRVFDVITDPLFGYINDRTNTRWGRRRPWIALATPVMMLSIYMLFLPPEVGKVSPNSFLKVSLGSNVASAAGENFENMQWM